VHRHLGPALRTGDSLQGFAVGDVQKRFASRAKLQRGSWWEDRSPIA
jgi:hypothetical protein